MGLIADALVWWRKTQDASLAQSLNAAAGGEKMAAIVHTVMAREGMADLLTPTMASDAMTVFADYKDGSDFVKLGAALAAAPEKLMHMERHVVYEGIAHAIAKGQTDGRLTATINALATNPRLQGTILKGIEEGCGQLVCAPLQDAPDMAEKLATLAYGTLLKNPKCEEAVFRGLRNGVGAMIVDNMAEEVAEVYGELRKIIPYHRDKPNVLQGGFVQGVALGLRVFNPTGASFLEYIQELQGEPELLKAIKPKQATTAAQELLGRRDVETCQLATLKATLREAAPHLAFAIANMPQSKRLVTYTADEMGSTTPMVVEATPRLGLRVSTCYKVYETPAQQIASWMENDLPALQLKSVPRVFEAVSQLSHSPLKPSAREAGHTMAQLVDSYEKLWKGKLPEAAQQRINSAIMCAARPD